MANELRTATPEEVEAAKQRVREKRIAVRAAAAAVVSAQPAEHRGKILSRLEEEEAVLDAELGSLRASLEERGISNPLTPPGTPAPPASPPAQQAESNNLPSKGNSDKDGGS